MHNHCNTRVKSSAAYHPFFNTKGGASASSFMKTRVQVRALRPQIFFLMHILLFLKWWNAVFLQDHVISALYIRFFFLLSDLYLIEHVLRMGRGLVIFSYFLVVLFFYCQPGETFKSSSFFHTHTFMHTPANAMVLSSAHLLFLERVSHEMQRATDAASKSEICQGNNTRTPRSGRGRRGSQEVQNCCV